MFNKKILAASMAAAISAGMVAQVHAMRMQENDMGQVLLAPTYITNGDLNTDITIVNTRTDAAIKAKVVFREGKGSSEVIDFILYLTPGDVWRGTVTGAVNAAVMESTDDSMTDDSGNFVSADNPLNQAFFDKELSGQNGWGHFEVYGLYSVENGFYTVDGTSIEVKQGMAKEDLRSIFNMVSANGGPNGLNGIYSNRPEKLQMTGQVQLTVGDNGAVSYNIPALGPDGYPATGRVIRNNNFDASIATPTRMGENFGPGGLDEIFAVEEAISASQMAYPYSTENGDLSGLTIAFVTKYRHEGDTAGICGGGPASNPNGTITYSAPFNDTTIGEIVYTFTSFDNEEHSAVAQDSNFSGGSEAPANTLPMEVNFLVPSYFSTSGWAAVGFQQVRPGCGYDGAPALGATLKSEGVGFYWNETADRRGIRIDQ